MNMWKSAKYTQLFVLCFMGHAFWKENIEARQSKMIGIKRFKLLS